MILWYGSPSTLKIFFPSSLQTSSHLAAWFLTRVGRSVNTCPIGGQTSCTERALEIIWFRAGLLFPRPVPFLPHRWKALPHFLQFWFLNVFMCCFECCYSNLNRHSPCHPNFSNILFSPDFTHFQGKAPEY